MVAQHGLILGNVCRLHLDSPDFLVAMLENESEWSRGIGTCDNLHRPVARDATYLVGRCRNQLQGSSFGLDGSLMDRRDSHAALAFDRIFQS